VPLGAAISFAIASSSAYYTRPRSIRAAKLPLNRVRPLAPKCRRAKLHDLGIVDLPDRLGHASLEGLPERRPIEAAVARQLSAQPVLEPRIP